MLEHSTPFIDTILDRSGLLQTALDLAARGIPVFPCQSAPGDKSRDKAPACAGGFKAASTDPDTVRRLFASPAAALIGVPTGEASGLDVLDLDPRHGSDAWWTANEKRIPVTLIHETRSGGKHLVFKHRAGLRSSAGALAQGVDVRADGGYVIHWPSAGCPVWLDEEPQPWPAWVLSGLAGQAEVSAAPADPMDRQHLAAPSAAAVVELLNAMPNPPDLGRDEYVAVMVAARGCELLLSEDDGGAVADAAVAWAERWGGDTDEAAKWRDDFGQRTDVRSGWPHLERFARRLISGYVPAAPEFDTPLPPLSAPKPARRRILAPGECEGVTSRPYRVKGLLAERDVGCLFGPPGAGKSLLAPLLAYRLAQGEAFFGLRTRSGPTLYVAAEDESGMERRVNALRLAHGDADGFGLVKGASDLLNPSSGDLAWLMSEVRDRKPALIVLDTLAMAFPGLIENDADAMGRVVAVARQLTEHGAAVLLVHHDSKARDGTPRGHSLLNGALDMAIALEPKDGAGVVRGRLTKNRNGSCEHEMAFRIGVRVLGTDQDGDPITAALAVEASDTETAAKPPRLSATEELALQTLRECVSAHGGVPVPEAVWIEQCAGLSSAGTDESRARAGRRMRAGLVKKGLVHFDAGAVIPASTGPGAEFMYAPTGGHAGGQANPLFLQGGQQADKGGHNPACPDMSGQHPIGAVRLSAPVRSESEKEGVP